MHHFVRVLDEYAMVEVIQTSWEQLKRKLAQLQTFEQLIQLHSDYLDRIMDRCFVTKKVNRVMTTLDQMFAFILKMCQLVRESGVDIVRDVQARADLQSVQTSFSDYSTFLRQVVKQLSEKG